MTARPPELSLVIPCYNEEGVVVFTIDKLVEAFRRAQRGIEIVAVDNGSTDRTGDLLASVAARYPEVTTTRVALNEGYGNGVLHGCRVARAPWVGSIPADGQVDAEDVLRLFEVASTNTRPVVAKVRRRFRMDGVQRKIVSVGFNVLVRMLWPSMASIDINGTPKIMPRRLLEQLRLESKGWPLDLEIMVKAHALGVPILEYNVFARLRGGGVSHVRPAAVFEFIRTLFMFRFAPYWRAQYRAIAREVSASDVTSVA